MKKNLNVWDKVAHDFGKIGPDYWSRFGKRLVEFANVNEEATVLDIGFGRGASLFSAADKVKNKGLVIGIDNSEGMVLETYAEIANRNINNIELKIMDATKLNFDDCYFDNVICGFGIGYLLFSEDKLDGIRRILKSGGHAAFSIWGIQKDQQWLTEIVNRYIKNETSSKNIGTHTKKIKFETIEDMKKILAEAGFKNVKVFEEVSEVVYKDKDEWWTEMNSNAVRGVFDTIAEQENKIFEQFKTDVFKGLERFTENDSLHFNMPVIYACGTK